MAIKKCLKKCLLLMGLCVLFTACSTARQGDSSNLAHPTGGPADLGVQYLLGRGVPQSDEKAFHYFSIAAENGDVFAANELGYLYAAGKGTSVDYAKALSFYQQAAEHGLASAQYNLGLMYATGMGTPPDRALARQWFQKAAARGFEPAKQALVRYGS